MIRTISFAFLVVFCLSTASPAAAATLTESFDFPTLSNRLSISSSSSAYGLGPATPGANWQMAKQSGTATGAVEIQTNFVIDGNFTAELTVDASNIGTGEVGMRLGEIYVNPWAEIFFQGPNGGVGSNYKGGGYGLAGFGAPTSVATLRVIRRGSQIRYYANNQQFLSSSFLGPASVTIFLRPYSGNGAFNPTIGQPDAHAAILNHFTLSADVFIPEPASAALLLFGIVAGIHPRLFLAKHHS